MRDYGNIADIRDVPGERMARMILFQQGWPCKNQSSTGTIEGQIVEWRWLQKEAALGSKAAPGVLELYEQLKPRVEAWEAAKNAPPQSTQKAPRDARAGV